MRLFFTAISYSIQCIYTVNVHLLAESNLALNTSRIEIEKILSQFAMLSTAPNWTFVFCAMDTRLMIECGHVAAARGYLVEVFLWNKPDLQALSSSASRQSTTCEYIVVVYKHDSSSLSLNKHYALHAQRNKLVRII